MENNSEENQVELQDPSQIERFRREFDPEAEVLWLQEIRRRDSEIRNGTSKTKPAERVLQEARDRLRCSK